MYSSRLNLWPTTKVEKYFIQTEKQIEPKVYLDKVDIITKRQSHVLRNVSLKSMYEGLETWDGMSLVPNTHAGWLLITSKSRESFTVFWQVTVSHVCHSLQTHRIQNKISFKIIYICSKHVCTHIWALESYILGKYFLIWKEPQSTIW